jgi:hypothetical protein
MVMGMIVFKNMRNRTSRMAQLAVLVATNLALMGGDGCNDAVVADCAHCDWDASQLVEGTRVGAAPNVLSTATSPTLIAAAGAIRDDVEMRRVRSEIRSELDSARSAVGVSIVGAMNRGVRYVWIVDTTQGLHAKYNLDGVDRSVLLPESKRGEFERIFSESPASELVSAVDTNVQDGSSYIVVSCHRGVCARFGLYGGIDENPGPRPFEPPTRLVAQTRFIRGVILLVKEDR